MEHATPVPSAMKKEERLQEIVPQVLEFAVFSPLDQLQHLVPLYPRIIPTSRTQVFQLCILIQAQLLTQSTSVLTVSVNFAFHAF